MMKAKRWVAVVFAVIIVLGVAMADASASLTRSFQFNGLGNWSIDAVGSNSTPVGTIDASVPCGGAIVKAFLYSSVISATATPAVVFDGTAYAGAAWTPLGVNVGFLQAWRADATAQVATKYAASCGAFSFVVDSETPNTSIDGEVLAIIYSHPAEQERTIAFLDGFSASTGDTTTFTFDSPLPSPLPPGFEALMSLGIGFGFQTSGQTSQVDIEGRRLTSCAGGQDDGGGFNGGLITAGGLGDSPLNPANPNCTDAAGPRSDDELYNLALGNVADPTPFLSGGMTSFRVNTLNPSNDDNIFFLGLNVTARGGVEDPRVPEPSAMLLLGTGLAGLAVLRRRRIGEIGRAA